MSTNRHTLSVTNTWTELFTPSDSDNYLLNFSGTPVHVYLSSTQIKQPTTITEDYFTIGGNISQLRADKSDYVYVRAEVGDNEFTPVMTDNVIIPSNDVDTLTEEVNGIAGELSALTLRVTNNEVWIKQHEADHIVFNRSYLHQIELLNAKDQELENNYTDLLERLVAAEKLISNVDTRVTTLETDTVPTLKTKLEETAATLQENISSLTTLVLQIMNRLVTAENWISEHQGEYKSLKTSVEILQEAIDSGSAGGDTSGLLTRINDLSNRMETAETNINTLNKQMADITGGGTTSVTELATTVKTLNDNFTYLNNSISELTNKHTAEEITETFNLLIEVVPDDIKTTITGIKDSLLTIVSNKGSADSYYSGNTVTLDSELYMNASASEVLY